MIQPEPEKTASVTFQSPSSAQAEAIAQMVYLCGPNLLSNAFGPGKEETLRCLSLLAAQPMTMFSYQFARFATIANKSGAADIAGLVVGLPYEHYAESERRLGWLVWRRKGWWRSLRLWPLASELSRCAEPLEPGSYYISALSVQEEWRKRGVGAALLDLSLNLARAAGCWSMVLDVEVTNTAAQRLYERMGYVVISESKPGPRMRARGIMGLRRMKKAIEKPTLRV